MKLHEYQAQRLLSQYGVPVPGGQVATTVAQVRRIAERLGGRVVLKAQVLTGGRGRAGGIRLVDDADEAERLARQMFGMNIHGYTVSKILVNEAVDIEREVYLGIALERHTAQPVLLASVVGNVEIAQVARDTPERVWQIRIDPLLGLRVYQARELAYHIGLAHELIRVFQSIAMGLYRAFRDNDALWVEVNPLAICSGDRMVSVDARMIVDDNALFRHEALADMRDETQETWFEQLARRYSIDYVSLGGSVGCVANGAGLAMATMDLLRSCGVRPSCFIDLGGGTKAEQVSVALRLAFANQPQAVLFNVFGGITRCDEVAAGIVSACQELAPRAPLVVRLAGWNASAGQALLSPAGVCLARSTQDAVRQVAALVRTTAAPSPATEVRR